MPHRPRCLGPMTVIVFTSIAGIGSLGHGDDWPQILGPHRNGVVPGPACELPSSLRPVWRHAVGQGYAGPAVVGRQVLIFHRVDNVERLEAVDRETGQPIWKVDFPAYYSGGFNPDQGPRCVPLVHDETVVVFGAAGNAHAVAVADGRKLWSRDLYGDYGAKDGYFGVGSSPIAFGDRVLFNVGGESGAGLVALDMKHGKTLWKATDEGASYSSPVMIERNGKTLAVFLARSNAVGVDPQDGKVAFRVPFGGRGYTVNAATPIVFGNRVFLTSSYGIGAQLLKLDGPRVEGVWSSDDAMSSQYNTPVFFDGHLYGIHGREDMGSAALRCIEAESGRVAWSRPDFGVATLSLTGDKLLAMTNQGRLVMIEASPARYRELTRATFTKHSTRALPAFSDGRMFCRDNQNGSGDLLCLDLRKK